MASPLAMYDDWTREDLIKRFAQLESKSATQTMPPHESQPVHGIFDFSAYPKRKIALKFCYSGWEYNGLAYQTLLTPLPTVEGVLFDAFAKAKLVDPDAGWEGCGWEKCGRTDRGVSAAGQVVSLWVRSALVGQQPESDITQLSTNARAVDVSEADRPISADDDDESGHLHPSLPYKPEHDYVSILNRILPLTIRVLAWSPASSNFSARFSCQYRHYKYFFSPQGLNIDFMRAAASRLVGSYDFRNLCKLDPTKQITMFKRKIISADIEPVDIDNPQTYVFNLIGSGFLYHQVRHIMAILFHVGAGLEKPSMVTSLLNVAEGAEKDVDGNDSPLEVVTGRPEYQMADALPLMLWDCGYKPDDVDWRIDGHMTEQKRKEYVENNPGNMCHSLQSTLERSQIFSTLNQHFLAAAAQYHPRPCQPFPLAHPLSMTSTVKRPMRIPLGGGMYKRVTRYTPLLSRVRMDPPEVVNERWKNGKGRRKEQRRIVAVDEDE